MEQLVRGELSVEDVPSDQPELLLHVVRADHLAIDHRRLEVRRELVVPVDDAVRVLLQLVAVRQIMKDRKRSKRGIAKK